MFASIKSKLGVIIGGVVLIIFIIVAFTFRTVNVQRNYSVLINLASRQGMLAQKFTKEVYNEIIPTQVRAHSLKAAEIATIQIKEDRKKYTEVASTVPPSVHLPLPAEFIRDVSAEINKKGFYRYELLSKWNVNADKGLKTAFEKDAFEFLMSFKDQPYYKFQQYGEKFVLRYATADVASSRACVTCHNRLSIKSKRDFKLGDVIGVLIVTIPVTDEIEIGKALFSWKPSGGNRSSLVTGEVFEQALEVLLSGGPPPPGAGFSADVHLPAAPTEDIHQELGRVKILWRMMQGNVKKINSAPVNSPEYLEEFMKLQGLNITVNKGLDKIVKMYVEVSREKGVKLKQLQLYALALAILTTIIGWYMVDRSIVTPIQMIADLAGSIAGGNLSPKDPSIRSSRELDALHDSLISMAITLKDREERLRSILELEKRINEELIRVGRYKADFVARMSHRLRTPLNHIIGFSSMLQDGDVEENAELNRRYAKNVYESGQSLLKLIEDLIAFTRSNDRAALDFKEFNLKETIEEVVEEISPDVSFRKQNLEVEVRKGIKTFTADKAMFRQILENLLGNAVRFTPDGGSIGLLVSYEMEGYEDVLRVAVSDNGPGIAPEDVDIIFDLYKSRERHIGDGNSLGLGLALAKSFVDLHGGRIWVKSVVGKGTTVIFILPVREQTGAGGAGQFEGEGEGEDRGPELR